MQEIQSLNLMFSGVELPEHHFAFCHVEAEQLDPNTKTRKSQQQDQGNSTDDLIVTERKTGLKHDLN